MPTRPPSPVPYGSNPENLILPDGPVGEEAAELLEEFVHPQEPEEEIDIDADYHQRRAHDANLPWWKTPSPWWLLSIIPFTAVAMSATIAPRIEIYTLIICSVLKPDIFHRALPITGGNIINSPKFSPILPPIIPSSNFNNTSLALILSPGNFLDTSLFDGQPVSGETCASDPVVQAAVSKLAAAYTSSMGILSCITAGWWSSYSDRHGRTRLLSIAVIGLLYTDFNFIFTAKNFQRLPGGYWFIIIGPLVEGCLGGVMAITAAMYAYVADTTTESARSRTLSLCLGLLFSGMAVGPTLGGLLTHFTGSPLSVFYAAFGIHILYALMVYLILPESLLKSQMMKAREKYDAELRESAQGSTSGSLARIKRLFAFLSPLTVLLPELKEPVPGENPLKRRRRDWNLTLVAGVYGLAVSIMGSYTTKFQYAAATFGWSSETLGYFITLVGASRAVFLTVVLPCFIKFFKPQPVSITRGTETEPLLSSSQGPATKTPHPSSFDLSIARVSLFVDVISYTLMALAPTALAFTGFSMLGSIGAGLNPALQSVALALYRRRGGTESGRLFGALSVIQSMSSQIISPVIYGLVYMKTVATFPRAIFILSTVTIMCSFALLAFVRLPGQDLIPTTNDVDNEAAAASSSHE